MCDSVLQLMGAEDPCTAERMPQVDRVFTMMDRDGDGMITKEEFITYCVNTNTVMQSLAVLPWKDTTLEIFYPAYLY